jgi:hypothetical protein
VQNWCRWLERRGLLAVLEPGTTAQFRPGILALGTGNLAREWQLTPSPGHETCTPPPGNPDPERSRFAGAREDSQTNRRSAADSTPPAPLPRLPQLPSNQNPQRRRERLAAAEQLRRDLPVFRQMSARAVRSAVRVYFAAGWTVADVEHALDHLPDCTRHIRTTVIHSPARWLAWRLGLWLSPDGTPLPPHSVKLAARAERHQAEQDHRRHQFAAMQARVGNYTAQASVARAMLAAVLDAKGRATGATLPPSSRGAQPTG